MKPRITNDNPPPKDPDRFLRVDHLTADLRGRSVRGGAVTLVGQAAKFVLTLASMAVLARILTPEDFGLIAMATVVIGFTSVFKDMGLSMATVQRAEVRHSQVSTLFWLNVLASVAIAVVTAAAAPALAWFYKEPRVTRGHRGARHDGPRRRFRYPAPGAAAASDALRRARLCRDRLARRGDRGGDRIGARGTRLLVARRSSGGPRDGGDGSCVGDVPLASRRTRPRSGGAVARHLRRPPQRASTCSPTSRETSRRC